MSYGSTIGSRGNSYASKDKPTSVDLAVIGDIVPKITADILKKLKEERNYSNDAVQRIMQVMDRSPGELGGFGWDMQETGGRITKQLKDYVFDLSLMVAAGGSYKDRLGHVPNGNENLKLFSERLGDSYGDLRDELYKRGDKSGEMHDRITADIEKAVKKGLSPSNTVA
jgi:hypothetical protein